MKRLGQAGDTLVEVLICIMIVSLILTGAYVTTNKSTLRVLDSQERAQALKLAQGQVEQVRQNATLATTNVFDQPTGNGFCMKDNQILTGSNANCKQDSAGVATTADPAYAISVSRSACPSGLPSACSMFLVDVRWNSISTKTQAYQQITYRLYE